MMCHTADGNGVVKQVCVFCVCVLLFLVDQPLARAVYILRYM